MAVPADPKVLVVLVDAASGEEVGWDTNDCIPAVRTAKVREHDSVRHERHQ